MQKEKILSLMLDFATSSDKDSVRSPEIALESDYYSQAFIHRKFQAFDAELFASKWFDYRFITPLEATRCYIEHYGVIYKRIYAREFDRSRAEHLSVMTWERLKIGLSAGETKAKRIFTGMWRGRQFADALGMPYDVYIEHAMTFRLRRWQQSYMPQPEHLYHEVVIDKVSQKWDELIETRLWYSELPAFLVHNFQNLAVQNDHHEWLFAQAQRRSDPFELIARVAKMDLIPIEKVYARYTEAQDQERIAYYLEQP